MSPSSVAGCCDRASYLILAGMYATPRNFLVLNFSVMDLYGVFYFFLVVLFKIMQIERAHSRTCFNE